MCRRLHRESSRVQNVTSFNYLEQSGVKKNTAWVVVVAASVVKIIVPSS